MLNNHNQCLAECLDGGWPYRTQIARLPKKSIFNLPMATFIYNISDYNNPLKTRACARNFYKPLDPNITP